jgi:IrrE N-terminal-like domain
MRTELNPGSTHARLLLERLQIRGIPDVLQIAGELRLKVKEEDLDGCEGLLIRPKGVARGIIAIKKSIRSESRKRFTIAHEIGHFVLLGHDEAGSICGQKDIESWKDRSNPKEREANDFAAELLIPTVVVKANLSRTTPSLSAVESVANECAASLSASAWKYCDLTSEQCAIVWSEHRKVSWSRRSPEFPFFIGKGQSIEQASYASNCFNGEKVPAAPEPVPADAWIDSFNLKEGSVIYEESRLLPSYDSVLTLLWIKENIEKKSDYQEEDNPSMDPNEFTVYRKEWPK